MILGSDFLTGNRLLPYSLYVRVHTRIITRTIFIHTRQIAVSNHPCIRIIFFQSLQKFLQSLLLLRCSGIGRPSADIETAFVADADGVLVVSGGMRPHHIEGTTCMYYPVAGDVVVIADVGKATGTVVTTAVVHGVTLRDAGRTTMYHDQVDATVVLVLRTG